MVSLPHDNQGAPRLPWFSDCPGDRTTVSLFPDPRGTFFTGVRTGTCPSSSVTSDSLPVTRGTPGALTSSVRGPPRTGGSGSRNPFTRRGSRSCRVSVPVRGRGTRSGVCRGRRVQVLVHRFVVQALRVVEPPQWDVRWTSGGRSDLGSLVWVPSVLKGPVEGSQGPGAGLVVVSSGASRLQFRGTGPTPALGGSGVLRPGPPRRPIPNTACSGDLCNPHRVTLP